MPTVLPLQIRKAPTVYEVNNTKKSGMTGNRKFSGNRVGTFYNPTLDGARKWNVGATGFEFVKPSSGTPIYRYYPSINKNNWKAEFLFGAPTYADSSNPRYSFWQSVSPNLYSFLNTYHSGGLPIGKLIKVWVSWDKYVSVSPRGFNFDPESGEWLYEKTRSFSYFSSAAGVCCRYAIFS